MIKSPFPGMDPFLEQDWLDVHSALVTYIRDQLQDQLPGDLCARMESRVFVEDEEQTPVAERHPDVRVVETTTPGGTAVLERRERADVEPDLWVEEIRREGQTQRFVEIVDSQSRRRVVTAIELISPSNKKSGSGRTLYLRKQAECKDGGVNLVEIDLTRQGDRLSVLPEIENVRPQPTYVACVRRAGFRTIAVYKFPLDEPLKPIRIPLRLRDEDIFLDLQPLVTQAYTRGRYGNLDYTRPLDPPPNRDEAEIVERLLREASSR